MLWHLLARREKMGHLFNVRSCIDMYPVFSVAAVFVCAW